jgi:hypothetical protein
MIAIDQNGNIICSQLQAWVEFEYSPMGGVQIWIQLFVNYDNLGGTGCQDMYHLDFLI